MHLGKKNIPTLFPNCPKLLRKGVVVLATTTSETRYLSELDRLRDLELEWNLQDDLLDYVDHRLRTEYHLSFLNRLLDPPFERLGQKGNNPCEQMHLQMARMREMPVIELALEWISLSSDWQQQSFLASSTRLDEATRTQQPRLQLVPTVVNIILGYEADSKKWEVQYHSLSSTQLYATVTIRQEAGIVSCELHY